MSDNGEVRLEGVNMSAEEIAGFAYGASMSEITMPVKHLEEFFPKKKGDPGVFITLRPVGIEDLKDLQRPVMELQYGRGSNKAAMDKLSDGWADRCELQFLNYMLPDMEKDEETGEYRWRGKVRVFDPKNKGKNRYNRETYNGLTTGLIEFIGSAMAYVCGDIEEAQETGFLEWWKEFRDVSSIT